MPAPPLSDDLARQAAAIYKAHGNHATKAGAKEAGVPLPTFKSRVNVAAARGLLGFKPVLPGFRVSQTTTQQDGAGNVTAEFIQQKPDRGAEFAMPAGQVVKGVSALVDPDGREIVKWIKTREEALDPATLVAWIKDAFKGDKPAARPVR